MHTERARLFVVDVSWLCLLQLDTSDEAAEEHPASSKFMLLRGRYSPSMRVATRCTGEGIKSLLERCPSPPVNIDHFTHLIRVAEVDENPANLRAEALTLAAREKDWALSIFICMGHKCHKSAERTWMLPRIPALLSGLTHCNLFLATAHSLSALRKALLEEFASRPISIFKHARCSEEAKQYRTTMLTIFWTVSQSTSPAHRCLRDHDGPHLQWQLEVRPH